MWLLQTLTTIILVVAVIQFLSTHFDDDMHQMEKAYTIRAVLVYLMDKESNPPIVASRAEEI